MLYNAQARLFSDVDSHCWAVCDTYQGENFMENIGIVLGITGGILGIVAFMGQWDSKSI